MFREGHHVQKIKRWCEEIHQTFHQMFSNFSWKFDPKSCKNHGKRLCAQISAKNPRLERLLLANKRFFVDFWVPGKLSGRPGSLAEASHFFINFRLPPEIGPDRSLGGPREAPGRPQASPRHLQRSILGRFWIDFPGGFPRSLFRRSIEFLHEVFASFCLNFLFMRVTLIRATEKLYWI